MAAVEGLRSKDCATSHYTPVTINDYDYDSDSDSGYDQN
jgi:hypothetical protein